MTMFIKWSHEQSCSKQAETLTHQFTGVCRIQSILQPSVNIHVNSFLFKIMSCGISPMSVTLTCRDAGLATYESSDNQV